MKASLNADDAWGRVSCCALVLLAQLQGVATAA